MVLWSVNVDNGNVLGGERFVQRAGPEASEIQRHIAVTGLSDAVLQVIVLLNRFAEFCLWDFQARHIAMVSYPKLAEAHVCQYVFCALYLCKQFPGNVCAVGKSAG